MSNQIRIIISDSIYDISPIPLNLYVLFAKISGLGCSKPAINFKDASHNWVRIKDLHDYMRFLRECTEETPILYVIDRLDTPEQSMVLKLDRLSLLNYEKSIVIDNESLIDSRHHPVDRDFKIVGAQSIVSHSSYESEEEIRESSVLEFEPSNERQEISHLVSQIGSNPSETQLEHQSHQLSEKEPTNSFYAPKTPSDPKTRYSVPETFQIDQQALFPNDPMMLPKEPQASEISQPPQSAESQLISSRESPSSKYSNLIAIPIKEGVESPLRGDIPEQNFRTLPTYNRNEENKSSLFFLANKNKPTKPRHQETAQSKSGLITDRHTPTEKASEHSSEEICVDCLESVHRDLYSCVECPFKLCSSCASFTRHPHVFLKRKNLTY